MMVVSDRDDGWQAGWLAFDMTIIENCDDDDDESDNVDDIFKRLIASSVFLSSLFLSIRLCFACESVSCSSIKLLIKISIFSF